MYSKTSSRELPMEAHIAPEPDQVRTLPSELGVPKWFCNQQVARLSNRRPLAPEVQDNERLATNAPLWISHCCGPAHRLALLTLFLVWGVLPAVLAFVTVLGGNECQRNDKITSVWVWCFFGFLEIAVQMLQCGCMYYIMIPWGQRVKEFVLPLIGISVQFPLWCMVMVIKSVISHVSILLNFLVLFRSVSRHSCPHKVFSSLAECSDVSQMASMHLFSASAISLVLIASTFMMPTIQLLFNVPLPWIDSLSWEIPEEHPNTEERFSTWAKWMKLTKWDSTHCEALFGYGRGARMEMIIQAERAYLVAEEKAIWTSDCPRKELRCIRRVLMFCWSSSIFMLCSGLLRGVLMLNLSAMQVNSCLQIASNHFWADAGSRSALLSLCFNMLSLILTEGANFKETTAITSSLELRIQDKLWDCAIRGDRLYRDKTKNAFEALQRYTFCIRILGFSIAAGIALAAIRTLATLLGQTHRASASS